MSKAKAAHIRNLFFWEKPTPFPADAVVLITGAGSGIGKSVALIYAARRYRLVLCDINQDAVKQTAAECEQAAGVPGRCVGVKCDVTSRSECQSFIDTAINQFGRIDILVLCAGIGAHNIFKDTKDLAMFHKCMNINFFGYLNCTHAAYPHLCKSRGVLTAITSFSGEVGLPYRTGMHSHGTYGMTFRSLEQHCWCWRKKRILYLFRVIVRVLLYIHTYTYIFTYYTYIYIFFFLAAYCSSKFAVTGFLEALRAEMNDLDQDAAGRFDIVIVCPPTTDTNLRKNSLTTDEKLRAAGSQHATNHKGGGDGSAKAGMAVEDCASCVVDATDRRLRKAFFPWSSTLASYLRPLIPQVLDRKIWEKSRL